MATQTELLERQEAATTELEALKTLFHQFLHGQASDFVATEAGQIPTLAGLVEEVRQRAGQRRNPISYFVNDLSRYEDRAEPLFALIADNHYLFQANLVGSAFGLITGPSGAPVKLKLSINSQPAFEVNFAAGAHAGIATGAEVIAAKGSLIVLELEGAHYAAKGLVVSLLGLVTDPPPAQAG